MHNYKKSAHFKKNNINEKLRGNANKRYFDLFKIKAIISVAEILKSDKNIL